MSGKVAKQGKERDIAVLPSGKRFRALGEHIFCLAIPLPSESSILVMPDKHRAPFGSHATGHPTAYGKVLAVGPKVKSVDPGDFVLIHPLNVNKNKIEEIEYYVPRTAAIYAVVTEES